MKSSKPVVGIILDGLGISNIEEGNPVKKAKMPFFQKLLKEFPNTQIYASEEYVGLPKGQMGNSEVGHLNLGAGRCLYQDLMRINKSIEDKSFYQNSTLLNAFKRAKKHNSSVHLIGLVSTGGVHSSIQHLFELLKMAKQNEVNSVKIHCITDGRDTPADSGKDFINDLQNEINKLNLGEIVTVCGRFYAMDREERFTRTEKAFNLIVKGKGEKVKSYTDVFEMEYEKETSDEYIPPYVINEYSGVEKNDEIIFFNFRPDRMRQIAAAFTDKVFLPFNRKLPKLRFTSMCEYDKKLGKIEVAFKPEHPTLTLSKYLSEQDFKQLKLAETTKYAHVTYYFNGGIEKPYKKESRILVESENVDSFADYPQMKAEEISKIAVSEICKGIYDFILINFSNCDMVGHTGNFKACVQTLEVLDKALESVVCSAQKMGYTCVIVADHGNVEDVREKSVYATSHTLNPVPFIVSDKGVKLKKGKYGLDVFAPTILDIMDLPKPKEMTAESLIK